MSLGSRIAGTPNNKTDATTGTMGFAKGTLPGDDKEDNAEDPDDHDDVGYHVFTWSFLLRGDILTTPASQDFL